MWDRFRKDLVLALAIDDEIRIEVRCADSIVSMGHK